MEAPGKLVICPTPLGNLGDMPPRATEALAGADCVCCEDTRVTGKLLAALGIQVRLERLDEEVLGQRVAAVVQRVLDGEIICFCSDAGMPGVSDPGARLVAAAREAGAKVEVLPGPTAAATAYVASGFSCPRFYFGGFFPRKDAERAEALELCTQLDAVAIFYESPKRVVSALRAIAQVLPTRPVAFCRELSKMHEEVLVGTAGQLVGKLQARDAVKGECVLVLDTPTDAEAEQAAERAIEKARQAVAAMKEEGALSGKEMVVQLQEQFGISRNDAYQLVHG